MYHLPKDANEEEFHCAPGEEERQRDGAQGGWLGRKTPSLPAPETPLK